MTTRHAPFTCETFEDRLADFLDGTLAAGDLADAVAHQSSCLQCAALVRDLEAIRRDAARLPELAPSRDLWAGIASAIETPVVPIAAGTPRSRGVTIPRAWLGAIAAALVAVTAGTTYMLTAARLSSPTSPAQVAVAPTGGTPDGGLETGQRAAPPTPAAATVEDGTPTRVDEGPTGPRSPVPGPVESRTELASRTPTPAPATTTYDREIESLRGIVERRSADLDPRTVAILENSLKVIDQAIVESRAAIARDPASRFLRDRLNRALDKKLELLRTAALLRPSA